MLFSLRFTQFHLPLVRPSDTPRNNSTYNNPYCCDNNHRNYRHRLCTTTIVRHVELFWRNITQITWVWSGVHLQRMMGNSPQLLSCFSFQHGGRRMPFCSIVNLWNTRIWKVYVCHKVASVYAENQRWFCTYDTCVLWWFDSVRFGCIWL